MPIPRKFIPPSQRRPVFRPVPGRPGLQQFIGFEGDPGTENSRPAPLRPRRNLGHYRGQGFGSLGTADRHTTFPTPEGTPGNLFQGDYDERDVWGGPAGGSVVTPTDPGVVAPVDVGPQTFDPGLSIPFGVSIIPWRNPTTMQSVPIIAATPANVPVLSLNMERNALIVQNNSTATSPDVAPTFYIGFNSQPQVGFSLAVPPLSGILFDIITPRDAVYIAIAGGTGVSVVTQGIVMQGTYAPI
jgi:hypothetical protein